MALLQSLQDPVLSIGLISAHQNSSFQLFEAPPQILASPIVSLELFNGTLAGPGTCVWQRSSKAPR